MIMHFFLAAHSSHSEPREFHYFDHMVIEYLFVVERGIFRDKQMVRE